MAELRTFIFTDIVRSVALKSEMAGRDDTERDRAFIETILTPHRERIETELAEHGGRVVSTAGDGHFLVFADTTSATLWAINVQRLHMDEPIQTPFGTQVEVRISMHLGAPQIDPRDPNNFVGKPVDYAARLNDFARGGQVLCSRAVAAILDDVKLEGVSLHAHGQKLLRGIGKVEVYEVVYRDVGPLETIYQPAKEEERQWTVIPPSPAGQPTIYPAPAHPAAAQAPSGSQQALLEPHTRRLGNYEIQELLGSGGMGDVYKARHTLFDRVRAIKVIKQRLVDAGRIDLVRRFYQEIKAIGKLDHKNIVVALESSTPEDRVHYLVMEYIDGISLDDLVASHGPMSVADACEAVRQAARGLEYIHKFGMVHRDIKPSNLMLTIVDAYRVKDSAADESLQEVAVVKILDLGLALLVDEGQGRLTQFGQRAMGTGMYMSPEQWKSPSVDIRADIYSLGCTLYHLLSGQPPFVDSDLRPEKAHEKSKVPPIKGPTDVPRKLWDVIKMMLAKDPDDRFQSPTDVVAAIAPFCDGHSLVQLARKYSFKPAVDEALEGTPPTSLPHADTLPLDSRPAPSAIAAARKRRVRTAALATLLAALVVAAVWYLRDPRVVDSPERLARAADLVVTLPGMNGLWWFEETPWLTPGERVRMLTVMRESDLEEIEEGVRDPNVQQLYDQLKALTNSIAQSHNLSAQLETNPDVQGEARRILAEEDGYDPLIRPAKGLDELIAVIEKVEPEERSAVDSHLLGVLYTHLQDFEKAEQILEAAKGDYQRMAAIASGQTLAIVKPLLALVCSDVANLEMARSDFQAARQSFAETGSQLALRQAVPIHVYALAMQSQAGLNIPAVSPDELWNYLVDADARAAQVSLAENHPLRAFLHERRAHLALETWQLQEAIRQAEQAVELRETFANLKSLLGGRSSLSESRAPVTGSHHAQQGWFRARQIVALALHFQGQVAPGSDDSKRTEAWVDFRQLEELLSRSQSVVLTEDQEQAWHQLKPNFRGRKADCELFTMGCFSDAAETYASGIGFAENMLHWDENPEKRHFLVFMLYKQAIALSLAGPDKQAQARSILEKAESLAALADEEQVGRFDGFRKVAQSLLETSNQGYRDLAGILPVEVERIEGRVRDRDNRQLMLFVAAYLSQALAQGAVPEQWVQSGEFPSPDNLQSTLESLLKPLRDSEQQNAGNNYLERVLESARAAVVRT